MNESMSTTKEGNVIWEEKNLIEPTMNSVNSGVSDVCDTITDTSGLNGNEHSPDTTGTKVAGIQKPYKKLDLIGKKFGLLTVIECIGYAKKRTEWKCQNFHLLMDER